MPINIIKLHWAVYINRIALVGVTVHRNGFTSHHINIHTASV